LPPALAVVRKQLEQIAADQVCPLAQNGALIGRVDLNEIVMAIQNHVRAWQPLKKLLEINTLHDTP
jgi:hypothetical protein